MSAAPYIPSQKTQDGLLAFTRQCFSLLNAQWKIRQRLEALDRAYMREVDCTEEQYKAKQANKRGDPTKFQNIVTPVIMPQIEAAVTYQQSVFLQGYPYFGVVTSPENVDEALAMDTIMGENQVKFNWGAHLLRAIRDACKYNLGAVEVDWSRQLSYGLETDTSSAASTKLKEISYAGNKIRHMDMYNTFFDTRCKPADIPANGEFAGYTELMSRIHLKKFLQELPTNTNSTKAFESGFSAPIAYGNDGIESYYLPRLNPESLIDLSTANSTDWMAWAGIATKENKIAYNNMYQVTTVYGRILPSDFDMKGIPAQNTPQVWKFIIVNNQVVVYCERMTNMHQLIPIVFAQIYDDGLGYQTKSMTDNLMPFQEITTALSNSSIASRRRAISDRMLFDPSRVSPAMINNESPTAKIPVRPSAFGTPLSEAVYAIPFRDDQFQINSAEIGMYMQMANQTSGLNPARQGQFVKGNKTRFEFSEIMGYANGRDQTVAITLQANLFSPVKEILKCNILQYQTPEKIYNREQETEVEIDPIALRKASLEFKISDGLTPSEKLLDGESLALAFQTMQAVPQIAQGYNIGPMFSYLMKSRGAKLSPFEKPQEQLAYEQAVGVWQQTVQQIVEAMIKQNAPAEQIQAALPPQPTPEQFGYNPAETNPRNRSQRAKTNAG